MVLPVCRDREEFKEYRELWGRWDPPAGQQLLQLAALIPFLMETPPVSAIRVPIQMRYSILQSRLGRRDPEVRRESRESWVPKGHREYRDLPVQQALRAHKGRPGQPAKWGQPAQPAYRDRREHPVGHRDPLAQPDQPVGRRDQPD